jgi:Fe2+ transport system protein FeoA
MAHVVPLDCLSAGQVGRVVDVDGEQEFVARLHEIGLRPGASVELLQSGSPCIVSLGNHRLSLRGDRLATVLVETT